MCDVTLHCRVSGSRRLSLRFPKIGIICYATVKTSKLRNLAYVTAVNVILSCNRSAKSKVLIILVLSKTIDVLNDI